VTKSALVTGASSGIGLAIARMLGQEGFSVTVVARRPDKLQSAALGLQGEGLTVNAVAANVANEGDVVRAIASHREAYGRLDLLVNNAGIGIAGPIEELTTKHMDLQYQIDLRAVVLFYRLALPLLRDAVKEIGSALVVNTASWAGKIAQPQLGVYSALKHGVVGFTYAMNREHGAEGIRSTVICPGLVDTRLADWYADVPRETMLRPDDVAEAVRFLLRVSRQCVIPEIQLLRWGAIG
jgi:NAD(P)-dependent dehydrogenase (short-subunit alcohol dehydrogenase family)